MGKLGFGNVVAKALDIMRHEKKTYKDFLPEEAMDIAGNLVNVTKDLWPDVQDVCIGLLRDEIPRDAPYAAVWWYSVLLGIRKDHDVFLEFIRYVRAHRDAFSANTQCFLWYQLISMRFRFPDLNIGERESQEELWRLFQEIVDEFAQYMDEGLLREIPPEERDKGFTLVITEQFLRIQHGPTKSALDRCVTIMTRLHERVLLLNDAEMCTVVGRIPFWDVSIGSYLDKKNLTTSWRGVEVPYWQCANNMPDIDTLRDLLLRIRKMAPGRIVTIGRGGILGNLASRMVPTLTVGMVPSTLEYTCAKYQMASHSLKTWEREMLSSLGFPESHTIEGVFTSGLKTQSEHVTREELGIPGSAFVVAVIGLRLDVEVTDEFLAALDQVVTQDIYVGFWGNFTTYEAHISQFARLRGQSRFFGGCEDILSRLEVCDLYVNPNRRGGGTSSVEAMSKGLPVVTLDYGDVAINAGTEFCVADYGQMKEQIQRYHDDKAYYAQMSQKARDRAGCLLDTDGEFVKILREMDRREGADREILMEESDG